MKLTVTESNFTEWLSSAVSLTNAVFVSLNLTEQDNLLAALPQAGHPRDRCVFLGCTLGPRLSEKLRLHFGLTFPTFERLPFVVYRDHLYTYDELYKGYVPGKEESLYKSRDWKIYTSFMQVEENHQPVKPPRYVDSDVDVVIARRLHDLFVQTETANLLKTYAEQDQGVVAIMGGHAELRGGALYQDIACLCRELAGEGLIIATGGGPGLMEAANLGAYFADKSEEELLAALNDLARAPRYDDPGWLEKAWLVRKKYKVRDKDRAQSLGLPTWFYGHEPPNIFASHIAKYFENSVREEGLLAIATHGVVFAPGNAGTVQEIFQDACQNYYVTYQMRSPMILFGRDYWDPAEGVDQLPVAGAKPAWPLLQQLAREKGFEDLVGVTSHVAEVKKVLLDFRASERMKRAKTEKAP